MCEEGKKIILHYRSAEHQFHMDLKKKKRLKYGLKIIFVPISGLPN